MSEKGNRTVKELVDGNIPYSDMTDNEIEAVVDYKASLLMESSLYKESASIMKNEASERVKEIKNSSDALNAATNEMLSKLLRKSEELRG